MLAVVGRKKINAEQMPLRLPEGTVARIDKALADKETRTDMVRDAIERELARREKAKKR